MFWNESYFDVASFKSEFVIRSKDRFVQNWNGEIPDQEHTACQSSRNLSMMNQSMSHALCVSLAVKVMNCITYFIAIKRTKKESNLPWSQARC